MSTIAIFQSRRMTYGYAFFGLSAALLAAIFLFAEKSFSTSAVVVLYSEGIISFQSAMVGLAALFGSSSLTVAILANVTVGKVLVDAAAEELVNMTLIAWLGPWALIIFATIIGIAFEKLGVDVYHSARGGTPKELQSSAGFQGPFLSTSGNIAQRNTALTPS